MPSSQLVQLVIWTGCFDWEVHTGKVKVKVKAIFPPLFRRSKLQVVILTRTVSLLCKLIYWTFPFPSQNWSSLHIMPFMLCGDMLDTSWCIQYQVDRYQAAVHIIGRDAWLLPISIYLIIFNKSLHLHWDPSINNSFSNRLNKPIAWVWYYFIQRFHITSSCF